MRNIWTIAKREYNHYFSSPIAYVVAFMIFLVLGIIFVAILQQSISMAIQQSNSAPDISPITGDIVFLLVFSVPALTMRLVSDETRMGTMELLLTAPVRDWELIVGKWLGGFLFILTIVAITLIYPFVLNSLVTPGIDQRVMMTAYLGVILVSAAFLGLGVGISAIFSNQIAAFFLSMGLFVFLWWLIGIPGQILTVGTDVFQYLDMQAHFNNTLNVGVIALGDVVYYLSLTALGLFTGTAAVEMRRWR
ncbi:MAG TPA: ABC transporter permease [Anaerolineales bacterium]|nr:ABC transporter permease [Anaerolineales bacterium]